MAVPTPDVDELYRREILALVQKGIDVHPRSAQAEIGPSEIGGCKRKVAHKVAYGAAGDREGGWAAHKGTVLHAWLDTLYSGELGVGLPTMPDGGQRFFSDLKLDPVSPHVNGGTLDLYDRLHETVIDWKLPGDWTIKAVRNGQFSEGYYVQANVYGLGLEMTGQPVSRVGLAFLPMCGDDLHSQAKGAIFRFWPYNRDVALEALNTVKVIKELQAIHGPQKVIEMMPMKSDFCSSCPAYIGSGDRRATCPGITGQSRPGAKSNNPFA